jgi:hypothetical protein
LTSKFGREFVGDVKKMLTKSGRAIIERNIEEYNKTYNDRKTSEEYYQTHKREFAEKKVVPKWDPADGGKREFS